MTNLDRYGRPLLQAIADWEREHGTICVMMPEEREGFIAGLQRAAIFGAARAAVEDDPITLYSDPCGFTFMDFPDHVLMQDGRKQVVLVSTIFDDGENVGPENTEAVCLNIEKAHAFIARRFTSPTMRVERVDEDSPISSYRLFFDDRAADLTVWMSLIDLEE
jgi:hypothetical protein